MAQTIFHGTIIHSISLGQVEVLESALIVVQDGRIARVEKDVTRSEVDASGLGDVEYLGRGRFLVPGFVDTHNHAPQWAQRGLGQGMHILDWLERITFPNEARFADPAHARRVYGDCVAGMLRQGVTTASYYGSLHGEATRILADVCLARGQRALVGKCNMDRGSPAYYRDAGARESLATTEDCIAHMRRIDPAGALVRPVLTPRFAVSCGPDLLAGLGRLAAAHPDLPVQTHFNEAEQEMRATRSLFPQFAGEADLYEHYGLLGPRSVLAHCTLMTDHETDRLRRLGCGVAHCPTSNMTVGGGFMAAPVRRFLDCGIKVGLGTDSGGGFSSSMLDAIRHSLIASYAREFLTKGSERGLVLDEAFHLATQGGAEVLGLGDEVGSFAVGKQFDAIVVDAADEAAGGIITPLEQQDSPKTIFDKFLMTGDDRNIRQVYVRGRIVHSTGKA